MPYSSNQRYVVNVPKRSGFDKSHRNSGTGTCGTLIPLLCDEVVPNTRLSLKLNLAAQMPPLASDTYMNVRLKAEAFFVPSRLLCASFEDFFCDFPRRVYTNSVTNAADSAGSFSNVVAALPVFQFSGEPGSVASVIFEPGSLLDYLGVKISNVAPAATGDFFRINPLPLVAYHLIWQEFYRNPRVQNPAFAPNLGAINIASASLNSNRIPSFPFNYYHRAFVGDDAATVADNTVRTVDSSGLSNFLCADGTSIFSLRQRNFGMDYFTSARTSAQQGAPQSVSFTVNESGDGSISIAALRAANSLQQFRERNNLPSPRLVDQVKVRYNANLSDGVAQRPICIGSASYDMSSNGINQTAPTPVDGVPGKNPFNSVAAQYGRAYGVGSDFIISDFTANEPGYIMVLISQVPEVSYSYGVLPMFYRYLTEGSITDMACALLQNVGDQPILQRELMNVPNSIPGSSIFGFTDRYADWMFLPNQVHGLFRDGSSLEAFVAQRALEGSTELSSAFLEIPKDYLNSVLATNVEASGLTYWYDCKLDYKVSMPLAEYSIPSLQDPAYEHGERVSIHRNGQIF